MTLFEPTFNINQLIVTKQGARVFNQKFHEGVNVICGENSSGKSTILDLLFHSVGGHITTWKAEAQSCDATLVEININKSPLVLRRRIAPGHQPELEIYWGDMETATAHSDTGWQKFPYKRTKNLESFSQVLFRALGLPEVRGDEGVNVTMHQILRVIFPDQTTPHGSIFRFERFDPALTRQAVGDLLTGIYDEDLYSYQLKLISLEKEFDEISRQLKSIYQLFGSTGQDVTIEFITQVILNSEQARNELYVDLENARSQKWVDHEQSGSLPEFIKELYVELRTASKRLHDNEDRRENLEYEISDSEDFINVLESRLKDLDISSGIQGQLGQMEFFYCPSCLSPLSNRDSFDACKLCGSEIEYKSKLSQFARMRNEIELQLRESREILLQRKNELIEINLQIPELGEHRASLVKRYGEVSGNFTSQKEAEIEEKQREIGYIDAKLEEMRKNERLFSQIRDLVNKKADLQGSVIEIKEIVTAKKASQEKRRITAYTSIAEETKRFLLQDLEREEAFYIFDIEVEFDFSGDSVFVRNNRALSASSMVYLRNSFHLALLTASCLVESFRYPRLMILDGIDDGGMELERNHNFQRILLSESESLDVQHQIIFATSMPADELKDSRYIVGQFYTHENKTLDIQ